MSEENGEAVKSFCASCGIAGGDDVKLKDCSACKLVKYCGVKCQKEHRPQHKKDCKKRAAELRDELLFKQPESTHWGNCPICCLPMPLDLNKTTFFECCSKMICQGCNRANKIREVTNSLAKSCPFCREPISSAVDRLTMKRVEANDPVSIWREGAKHYNKEDYHTAVEYWKKAAELGDVGAHYNLSCLYHEGLGVEKDVGKEIYHLEVATIGGHPDARCRLAGHELKNGNTERSVKHATIAATQGHDNAMKFLMGAFKMGIVRKEELDAALRAHHAAVNATKSPQREAAEKKVG